LTQRETPLRECWRRHQESNLIITVLQTVLFPSESTAS
jgi:hypothetical protein